jgi:glutamate formiminotransferase/formiminotetrahydrofolate cyclodeaminase
MSAIIECVPNFSEGRRPQVIEAITRAISDVPAVQVVGVSSDHSHNRTVVTFVGPPEAVCEAAFRSIAVACNRINLDEHQGEHPRIGAADVVPLVPVRGISLEACAELARDLGRRVGEELGQAVYLYEAAATRPDRENLADVRRGEYELWKKEVASNPDRRPDFGPAEPRSSGATVIGARPFLVAYNVYLNTDDVQAAKQIARRVRNSSGGLRYVKALGLLVNGYAQISMNLTNTGRTPIHRVMEMIRCEAANFGYAVTHAEVVGLIPEGALTQSARWYLQLHDLDEAQILERHLEAGEGGETAREPEGQNLEDYVSAVASGDPTPGGGSAAALTGALAAALGAMSGRLTIGRPQYTDVNDIMEALTAEIDELRAVLMDDVELDAQAYMGVMEAMRLPNETDEERQTRATALEAATVGAAEVPLRVAQNAVEVLRLLGKIAQDCNPNGATDAGAGAHLARAAVEAAVLNVRINAASLQDQNLVEQWQQEVARLQDEAAGLLDDVLVRVHERGSLA